MLLLIDQLQNFKEGQLSGLRKSPFLTIADEIKVVQRHLTAYCRVLGHSDSGCDDFSRRAPYWSIQPTFEQVLLLVPARKLSVL
jgi:hypothetical protein